MGAGNGSGVVVQTKRGRPRNGAQLRSLVASTTHISCALQISHILPIYTISIVGRAWLHKARLLVLFYQLCPPIPPHYGLQGAANASHLVTILGESDLIRISMYGSVLRYSSACAYVRQYQVGRTLLNTLRVIYFEMKFSVASSMVCFDKIES